MPIENQPPQLAQPIADQFAGENNGFSFTLPAGTFSDADAGDTLVYSATLANGTPLPAWLAFDAQTGSFSGTPGTGDIGTLSVLVQATDSQGASATDVFQIDVLPTVFVGNVGDQWLSGTPFNDVLDGGGGNDTLAGFLGDDVYLAGIGRVWIFESEGNDELRFAAGIDPDDVERIRPEGSNELVLRVVGTTDQVTMVNWYGGPENQIERVVFADGTVWDAATTGTLRQIGTEGNDILVSDFLVGGVLEGRGGDDILAGGIGNDVFLPGTGMDMIIENGGSDELRLAAGINPDQVERIVDGGNLVLRTVDGTNQVTLLDWFTSPEQQVERVVFGDGTVWDPATAGTPRRIGTEGSDFLQGSGLLEGRGGDDTLFGGSGSDTLDGGAGSDWLVGDLGDDVYLPGTGVDGIQEFGGNDELRFGAGIDPNQVERIRFDGANDLVLRAVDGTDLVGISNWFGGPEYQIERVVFADGTVWDAETASSLRRLGTEGSDFLQGSFSVGGLLEGRGGDDTLIGGSGSDTIDGGAGNDMLAGQDGDDVYLPGTGMDSIFEFGGNDELRLAAGIDPNQVERIRFDGSNDLVLRAVGSTEEVSISNWFGGPENQIERVVFADGTVWDAPTTGSLRRIGTEGADFLQGNFTFGGLLEGRGGDDFLFGGIGDDVYLPGTGMNTIFDGGGNDELRFDAGINPNEVERIRFDGGTDLVLRLAGSTDEVRLSNWFGSPENQIERVAFADGTVWDASTIGTLRRIGTEGADFLQGSFSFGGVLDGRGGDDFLIGSMVDDVYLPGTGMDTIFDNGGNDELRLAPSVSPDQVERVRLNGGPDLVLRVSGTTDEVIIANWFGSPDNQIERVVFADGTVWDPATTANVSQNHAPSVANPIADQSASENAVFGFAVPAGTFTDPDAGDVLTLSARLAGGAPLPAWLSFDAATATFTGTPPLGSSGTLDVEVVATDGGGLSASDQFGIAIAPGQNEIFGTPGNDLLIGTAGSDLIWAGEGNDEVQGLEGDDVIIADFTATPGDDTVYGGAGSDYIYGGGGTDLLIGGTGNDVYEFISPSTVVVEYADEGHDEIRVVGSYALPANVEDLYLFGSAVHATGNDLDNFILATTGDDLIDGGAGADHMQGGDGNDTYVVDNVGDLVIETPNRGNDTIQSSVTYSLDSIDFPLGHQVENLVLTGTAAIDATGNALDNVLTGNSAANVLTGGGGNDRLEGGDGDDTLIGGSGSDVLVGGAGADTYVFSAADDTGNTAYIGPGDRVQLQGMSRSSVLMTRDESNLYITMNDTGASIVLRSASGLPGEEGWRTTLEFGDGSVWLPENVVNTSPYVGTNGADVLNGSEFGDQIFGVGGNDVIHGNDGNDVLYGGGNVNFSSPDGDDLLDGGSGRDTMYGGGGNDRYIVDDVGDQVFEDAAAGIDTVESSVDYVLDPTLENLTLTGTAVNGTGNEVQNVLVGNAGANTLYGHGGDDSLSGMQGNDLLFGGAGNDQLSGGDGADSLYGDAGDDVLESGAGHDEMQGGAGNDTYLYARGSGFDVVWEFLGTAADTDIVLLGADIAPSDISVRYTRPTQQFFNDGGFLLTVNDGSDVLKLIWSPTTGREIEVEEVRFANGTVWNETVLAAMAIQNGDGPALVTALADQSATEDAPFIYEVPANAFDDVDIAIGDSLAYSASLADGSALPTWLAFDAATRTFSGTPANGDVGATSVRVTATDESGRSVSDVFDLTVVNTNDAPVAVSDSFSVDEDFGLLLGRFSLVPNDRDDDGDVLTIVSVQNAQHGSVTLDQFQNSLFVPEANYNGPASFQYTITDGNGGFSTATVNIAVQPVNDAPTMANPIADRAATEDAPFSFTVPTSTFADVDAGEALDYSAALASGDPLPAWLSFDAATRSFSGTPLNADVGTMAVRVTATDGAGASASDVFEIAVANTNDAPTVAAPIASQTAQDTLSLSFTVPAGTFADVDAGDALTYSAGPLPAWLSFDAATRTFTGTPGTANIGVASVEVRATDATGATVSDSFDIVVGPAPDRTITGTAGNDTLTGGSGNDTLSGLGGADSMSGGLGNDRLDGGAGNDTMLGGPGNDTYVVAQNNDVTTENPGEGIDTVESAVTRTLGNNLENLILTAGNAIDGTGNALDNLLVGNAATNTLNGGAGNDTLDGGAGNDSLVGGTGDDTYVVAQTGDAITEFANQGVDTVRASLSWTLVSNLENLVLTGTGPFNGTGNGLANVLVGNAGNNTLTGNAGNDTLEGMGGADILAGGTGNDTYRLGRGYGADRIQESDATAGNSDLAQFLAGVARDQIWFQQAGNDLVASIIGTADKLTVQNWYVSAANRVEQFRTADGSTLLESNVQNLVNAMAAFAPPAPGQETLPPDYAAALNPVIAANWQ